VVPVLRDPVVLVPAGPEVRPEPAPSAGGDASRPQERHRQPAEGMAAGADAITRWARLVDRPSVDRLRPREESGGVALVDGVRLLRGEFDAVEGLGHDVVDEQSLDSAHDLGDVARGELVAVEPGETARRGVEVESRSVQGLSLSHRYGCVARRVDDRRYVAAYTRASAVTMQKLGGSFGAQ